MDTAKGISGRKFSTVNSAKNNKWVVLACLICAIYLYKKSHTKDSSEEIKTLVDKLVKQEDTAALVRLTNHQIEFVIRDALIKHRKLDSIEIIFPRFSDHTLSHYRSIYYPIIEKGDVELMALLIKVGLGKIEKSEHSQIKDLFLYSIEKKQLKIADLFLLDGSYDLNTPYYHQVQLASGKKMASHFTAAYVAVLKEDPETLSWLIEKGANVTASNNISNDKRSFILSLEKELNDDNPLALSARTESSGCFEKIIDLPGVNIDTLGIHKETALLAALKKHKYERAMKLLIKGANPTTKDLFGNEPLLLAIASNDIKMIKLILAAKANPRCENEKKNVWHMAAESIETKYEIYQLFRDLGLGDMINNKDVFGFTPLAKAVTCCNVNAFRELLRQGAHPGIRFSHFNEYTKRKYSLPQDQEVTLKMLAQAVLEDIERDLKKSSNDATKTNEKIASIQEIIALIDSPKVSSAAVAF